MTHNNVAEMPENYYMNDDVITSTVITTSEAQEVVASNDNNNMEGPKTPPKGGPVGVSAENVTNPQQPSEELESPTFEDIIRKSQLSPDTLAYIIESAQNDNLFPCDNLNKETLVDTINNLRNWVDTEKSRLTNSLFPFNYRRDKAVLQSRAAKMLILECFIGEKLAEDYHLSPRLARDFQHLTWEGVKAAIELALRLGDIPTRAMALSRPSRIKARQNESDKSIKHTKFELNYFEETEFKTLNLKKPMYITTLFSNISIGLSRAHEFNLHCAVATEWDKKRADWHKLLYPDCHMVIGDFTTSQCFEEALKWHKKKGCEVVMASCCCEPFSILNVSANKGNVPEAKQFYYAADFILKSKPKYFVLENVPGFVDARPKIAHDVLKGKDGNIRCIGQYLQDVLGKEYYLNFGIYTAADFGCVEDRKRLIILGCRKDIHTGYWKFPKKCSSRKMLWEVIGKLKSLGNGEIDPEDSWHYARELPQHIIEFLEHTPTGCSAWDNEPKYQPLTIKGEYSNCNYKTSYTRNNWQDQCPTITTGNGEVSDLYSIHPGKYNPDTHTYSDCRVFSLRELQLIMNTPPDFFDKLNLQREANGMLNESEENALRRAIGQHFCPDHVNSLFSTLPIPANDNNPTADEPLA